MLLLSSADFFQNQLFQKILSGTLSECQTVWIQIRTDIVSVLIWVQTVCKSYQQTTLVSKELIQYLLSNSFTGNISFIDHELLWGHSSEGTRITVVIPLRQFGSRRLLRCYSKITFK